MHTLKSRKEAEIKLNQHWKLKLVGFNLITVGALGLLSPLLLLFIAPSQRGGWALTNYAPLAGADVARLLTGNTTNHSWLEVRLPLI
jgi:hypothetical protein